MTTKTRITAAVAVLLALAVYVMWPADAAPASGPGAQELTNSADPASAQLGASRADEPPQADAQRQLITAVPSKVATSGMLVVSAFYGGEERLPAGGVTLSLRLSGGDVRTARRTVTDDNGVATFDELPPGRVWVWGDRFDRPRGVEIVAGETTEFELTLPVGMTLRGRVVDPAGLPIVGAQIDVAVPGLVGRDPEVLAISDTDGRFVLRGAPAPSMVGARASGYLASRLAYAYPEDGQTAEVELRLQPGGGTVEGLVVGPDGQPVQGALVCVGQGQVQGLHPLNESQAELPALVRSGADGQFAAVGLAPGEQPVWARAVELAPWRGTCVVAAHGTTGLRIDLQRGAVLRGRVLATDGATTDGAPVHWTPVADATIELGKWGEVDRTTARSGADGSFEMRGLPDGEVEIRAEHDVDGKAMQSVLLVAGAERTCEVRLSRGLELRGQVTDENGEGVAKVYVEVSAPRTRQTARWGGFARTDEDGRFAVANCPVDRPLTVEFGGKVIEPHRLIGVDPRKGDLKVQVRRLAEPSVHITGVATGPDGQPLAGVAVSPWCDDLSLHPSRLVTEADGVFAFGPLPAGTWRLSMRHSSYPSPRLEPRALADGDRWDVGEVKLEAGGTAILRSVSVPMTDLRFMFASVATGELCSILADREELETSVLRPGDYRLMVWGQGAAAHVIPFSIQAGQKTRVEVRTEPGVRQRLEFIVDERVELGHGGTLRIYRGDQQLVDSWRPARLGEPWTYDVWLAPGNYRVTMSGKLRGEAELTVGTEEMEPVQVRMR